MAVNIFALFMWLIVPWTTPGVEIWRWRCFAASMEGVRLCIDLSLKANAILAVFSAFVAPLSVYRLARGLASLRCPVKLTWLLLLMEENIHILKREWLILANSARLRAFRPNTSLRTYSTLAAMPALWIARAQSRAERLREAMLLAGFTGKLPFQASLPLSLRDIAFYMFILCLCAALLHINYASI